MNFFHPLSPEQVIPATSPVNDQRKMLLYLISSSGERIGSALLRNFTYANVATFLVFIGRTIDGTIPNPVDWGKMFVVSFLFFLSGWVADRAWIFFIGQKIVTPFGLRSFAGRTPFFFIFSGILSTLAMLILDMIDFDQVAATSSIFGLLQIVCQIPLQWFLFNRLRKHVLIHL